MRQLQTTHGNQYLMRLMRSQSVQRSTSTGDSLPDDLRHSVEGLSGVAMDDVQVHYDSPRPREVQALAYTQGSDIHIGPGQEKHLPHEAWHAVQQKRGEVKPTMQLQGQDIDASSSLEREADVMGQKAVQRQVDVTSMPTLTRKRPVGKTIQRVWDAPKEVRLTAILNILKAARDWSKGQNLSPQQEEFFAGLQGSLLDPDLRDALRNDLNETLQSGDVFNFNQIASRLYSIVREAIGTVEDVDDGSMLTDGHSDDEHGDAPEEAVEWDELALDEFESTTDPTLIAVFINLIKHHSINLTGYSKEEITEKYETWYQSGVYTRSMFKNLFPAKTLKKEDTLQRARTPNTTSEQDAYTSSNFGPFKKVIYKRDGKGNIDFAKPLKFKAWSNPIKSSSVVELSTGSKSKAYGIMKNGTKVKLAGASRAQHFAIANRIKKIDGSGSPAGWTWHHLTPTYKMHLVDRVVHQKHGHNGGFLLWK
ncbi:MAG: DUF4157 domain-containing protein [Anaerolineae bacterium]|jgi:hypothetical protein|nr:DUF4157 domain-containing protein [Anaerolineae bacterium]